MRPRSAISIFLTLVVAGLAGMAIIGINLFQQTKAVEQAAEASHQRDAEAELRRNLDKITTRLEEITTFIANWDETRQQLSDPTYYYYWRKDRIRSVKTIPDYITSIELYQADGMALRTPRNELMPTDIPGTGVMLRIDKGQSSLLAFAPIEASQQQAGNPMGFVGVLLDVQAALRENAKFLHINLDSMSLRVSEQALTNPSILPSLYEFEEYHDNELEVLKAVIYKTYGLAAALIVLVLLILLWIVFSLLTRPLARINRYLGELRHSFTKVSNPRLGTDTSPLAVRELNNLLHELCSYHDNWVVTKATLDELNRDLESRVRERTLDLQSVNAELESFAYSVSHDLRAPLRAICGFSDILMIDHVNALDDDALDYLKRIQSSSLRMAQLIDDLLALSRITRQELTFEPQDITDIARSCVDRLQEQDPDRRIEVVIEPDMICISDRVLLTVLLDNLISNAWKYSSKKEHARIECGVRQNQGRQEFFVRDNGEGFDMQYSNKLFQPFQRLHGSEYEGTGIGLATVYRIIQRHRGQIRAESEPGKGATFYFSLACQMNDKPTVEPA